MSVQLNQITHTDVGGPAGDTYFQINFTDEQRESADMLWHDIQYFLNRWNAKEKR